MRKKVSIIVPSYNQGDFVAEALESVLAQSFCDWECIIVDDGSTDKTYSSVKKYVDSDSRFRYYHQENQGVSAARNFGIRHSSGEYILPLDADDKIGPTYLAEAVAYLEENRDCKLVYCYAMKFGVTNQFWHLPEYSYERLLCENIIFCSAIFRRSDFDNTDGYNTNMRQGLEDWDFWLSFLGPEDIIYRIEKVLFYYRVKQQSRNKSMSNYGDELLRQIYINHQTLYKKDIENIVLYKHQLNDLQIQLDLLSNSLSLKIGRIFTFPFGKLRDFVIGLSPRWQTR